VYRFILQDEKGEITLLQNHGVNSTVSWTPNNSINKKDCLRPTVHHGCGRSFICLKGQYLLILKALRSAYSEQGTQTLITFPRSSIYFRKGLTRRLQNRHLPPNKPKNDIYLPPINYIKLLTL
jgi:hypothetical protein